MTFVNRDVAVMTDDLSDEVRDFARRVEQALAAALVSYKRSDIVQPSVEPHVFFELRTRISSGLSASLIVHGDVFTIRCNAAEVRLESTAYAADLSHWIDDSIAMLTYLLRHDLRLKTRRGWFGGSTGAIYFEPPGTGAGWSGELFAIWWGRERTYADWLERRSPRESDATFE
jgi:hypothetical protein